MKSKIFIATGIILCLAGTVLAAAGLEPGSSNDPLVTKSYVDSLIEKLEENFEEYLEEQLEDYLDELKDDDEKEDEGKIENADDLNETLGNEETKANNSYVIKEFPENTKIICYANCELILRSGKATINSFVAADGTENGIQDITDGIDLKEGEDMPINHLLLVPRTDTRGFTTTTPVFVMIRGEYDIVE